MSKNIILFLINSLLISNFILGQNVNQNIKYYDNEKIKEVKFEKGAIITSISFYKNGLLESITSFYLNKKHGKYLNYYENGQLFVDGQYDKGTPVGNWIEYYSTGDTLCKYSFKNDTLILNKFEISNPKLIFNESDNNFKIGDRNYFKVIFPNLPNKFIYASIKYGQMIYLGACKYCFIVKKPGEAEIIFSLRKNNFTDGKIIYKKKILINK